MGTTKTIILGAIAGSTIFLSLPMGRMRNPRPSMKAVLNAFSAGILLFLLFDIWGDAFGPVEGAVEAFHVGNGDVGRLIALALTLAVGFGAGLLSLLYLGRYQRARRADATIGPGAMSVAERPAAEAARSAMSLGMSIAAGIGLHNFSEGLAIGQAAKANQLSLAVLLVVGFALHNATEGFGIVGPLAAGGVRASWSYLALAGLIAGGPTFLGTLVGLAFHNDYVFVGFLAVAAGAILYVVSELLHVGRRLGEWSLTMWGVFAGVLAGVVTELVIKAAGG